TTGEPVDVSHCADRSVIRPLNTRTLRPVPDVGEVTCASSIQSVPRSSQVSVGSTPFQVSVGGIASQLGPVGLRVRCIPTQASSIVTDCDAVTVCHVPFPTTICAGPVGEPAATY